MEKKIKISLLANTGIGNGVFSALINNPNVVIDSVITRKFHTPFPYFDTVELYELVEKNSIHCFYDVNVNKEYYDYICNRDVDLIIVAGFNQIISEKLINIPKIDIINFHPSLLPKYRGPNPISWVLLNGEKETGLTVHKLIKALDAGDIIKQRTLPIEEKDNVGSLLFKFIELAENITNEIIGDYLDGKVTSFPQDETKADYQKKPVGERFITNDLPFNTIINRLKAFYPFPSAIYIDDLGKEYKVSDYFINDVPNNQLQKDKLLCTLEKEHNTVTLVLE